MHVKTAPQQFGCLNFNQSFRGMMKRSQIVNLVRLLRSQLPCDRFGVQNIDDRIFKRDRAYRFLADPAAHRITAIGKKCRE